MPSTVLIVDDDADLRAWLRGHLEREGREVVEAADGVAALEEMRRATFDVMLLDLRLPEIDGTDVLRQALREAPELEIIVLTGNASVETAVRCLREGASDLLQKPCSGLDVSAAVSQSLERRRVRTAAAIYQACQVIFTSPTDARLPQRIVDAATRVMGADEASLLLLEADGCLHVAYTSGPAGALARSTPIRIGGGIAGRVLLARAPAILNGPARDDPRFRGVSGDARIRSSLVYPLLSGERAVGVLTLNRTVREQQFREQDIEPAAVLGAQILLALENTRLAKQLVGSERLAAIGMVAAGVAHEINNPVAYALANQSFVDSELNRLTELGVLLDTDADIESVRACWERLRGTQLLEELRQASREAGEGCGRIRDIVRDLRSAARSEKDSVASVAELNEVVRSAIRVASAEFRSRATLIEHLGADAQVRGEPGRLSQVFINLLVNAGQALADPALARREIVVTTRREGELVIAEVTDSGPGIKPEHLPRLFEPFFTTKEAGRGTGLGLSISRDIVRRVGGDIRMASTLGVGTTVTVVLPAVEAATDSAVPVASATAPPAAPAPSDDRPAGAAAPRARVLIVDDEPALLRSLERCLGRHHDVVVAENAAAALAALHDRPDFHLVLCDVLMPDINGIELYRRALERHPEISEAFVFMTGSSGMRDFESGLLATGRRVLHKPFDLGVLRELAARRAASPPPVRRLP
jgi:two-component system, NtrC family, sensor kinase